MRIAVTGGRGYNDRDKIYKILSILATPFTLIHGDCSGVDKLSGEVAEELKQEVIKFPPDWKKYGKSAGPIRNQQMIDEGNINVLIAFPGGDGTMDMITKCQKAGIFIICVERGI